MSCYIEYQKNILRENNLGENMNREEVYCRLTNVFKDVFDDDSLVIDEATTSKDIDDWDSLMQINLVVAIQDEFNFKMSIGQMSTFSNVGEVVDLIMKNGK